LTYAFKEASGQSYQVSDQVKRLLQTLRKSPRSASDLMKDLEMVHRPTFGENYLRPALAASLLEMPQPNATRALN
jgi:hypothetical protein